MGSYKRNKSFELNTSKSDFIDKFNNYVDYKRIDIITAPVQKESINIYVGEIENDEFIIKKIAKSSKISNIEICKGKVYEKNNKLEIHYEINGLSGFLILIISILLLTEISFYIGDEFSLTTLLSTAPLLNIINYILYRVYSKQIINDINDFEANLERDIRNWFRI